MAAMTRCAVRKLAGALLLALGGRAAVLHAQPGESAAPAPRRVVVAIGIGRYQNPTAWHDILPAEASAREMQTLLGREFGYEPAEGSPLIRPESADAIDTYLSRVLGRLTPNDDLIVFYSGHGVTIPQADASDAGYLVPFNAAANPAPSGLIPIRHLLTRLAGSRARNVLVILDACESGVAAPRFGSISAGAQETGTSRMVITAAEAGQKASADGGSRGTTLFTGALLDLLERGDCDISGEGYCTATELGLLIRRRLAARKGGQTPVLGAFGGDPTADFRIVRFGAETLAWSKAKACDAAEAECLDTAAIEAFLRQHPAGVYAAAARKMLRERVERSIRSKGEGVTSDLRLVSGDAPRQSAVWAEEGVGGDERPVFMWVPDAKSPFWMQKYEVSVAQYRRFLRGAAMPRAPSFNRGWTEHPDQPMVNVSWFQAQRYCNSLGGALPSLEQWRTAARFGQDPAFPERFPWNDEPRPERANLAGSKQDGAPFTASVRGYPTGENALQIRNLIGNVSEWTSTMSESDPGKAVAAGGSFAETWEQAGFGWKTEAELGGSNTIGFRCVVTPPLRQ